MSIVRAIQIKQQFYMKAWPFRYRKSTKVAIDIFLFITIPTWFRMSFTYFPNLFCLLTRLDILIYILENFFQHYLE